MDPRFSQSMPFSLIGLVRIRLIVIHTMALASGIVTSSHLTHKGLHGSIVIWSIVGMRYYKAIIRRLVHGLIPGSIMWIFLSVTWFIRRSIRDSISWTMRWSTRRSITWSIGRYMSC